MAGLFVQYLAMYNNENLSNSKNVQKWIKYFPKTYISQQ